MCTGVPSFVGFYYGKLDRKVMEILPGALA